MRHLRLLAVVIVSLAAYVSAQVTTGSIIGIVTDSTGAVVPSASIVVTNLDTDAVFKTSSDNSGNYAISPLGIGRYSVAVEARGFERSVNNNIVINVADRIRLDFKLRVGSTSESVIVQEATPLLQTASSSLGQVVDSENVVDMPLNGRLVTQLAVLSAGTAPGPTGQADSNSGSFTANGMRTVENNFLLDGVDNNNMQAGMTSGTGYVIMPPPDAIAEFKVQTNSMSAEFGHSGGGVMNVTTRSGTNRFHGSVFEFLRNSAFDAENYFQPTGSPIPPFKQNQFGGTIGGPIRRNRTFFFADYQGTRIAQGQTDLATVPLPAWASGDFSGLCSPSCSTSPTIFDPSTTTVVNGVATRQPFAGNQIPLGRIDPVAQAIFKMLPPPNVPGAGDFNNFLFNPTQVNNIDQFDTRFDEKVSDSDSIFFRFSFLDNNYLIPGALPPPLYDGAYQTGTNKTNILTGALAYTHVFNPRMVNEFRTAYIHNHTAVRALNTNVNGAGELNIPGIPFAPGIGGFPNFSVSGLNSFGGGLYSPTIEVENEYLLMDILTLVRGSHVLKLGVEARPKVEFDFEQPIAPRGAYQFSGQFTRDPNNPNSTGAGVADFFLGVESQAQITAFVNDRFHEPAYYAFIQDDYRATKSLTINAGLRYEFTSNPTEQNDRQASFDLPTRSLKLVKGTTTALPSNFDFADIPVNRNASRTLVPNNYLNFAPRLGFAYNLPHGTVLSAGFGVFYSSFEAGPLSDPNPGLNPPFYLQSTFIAPSLTQPNPKVSQLSEGFPDNALSNPDIPSFFSVDSNLRNPYVLDWNAEVQHELKWNTVFDIAYAGSGASKLYEFRDENQPLATIDLTAPLDPRRPMPYLQNGLTWWGSSGHSTYHALEVTLNKHLSDGVNFLAAYTYGKSIDEASQASFPDGNAGGFRDSTRHPNWEKGLSDFDFRQRFVFSYICDLPFGRGKRFASGINQFTNAVVGGWQLAGDDAFQTGNPNTIVASFNSSNSTGQNRPDRVPGVSLKAAHQGPGGWYNLAALQPAALGTYGDMGRNTLEGPGVINVNFSLFKNFNFRENREVQFRVETFNLLNHPNFLTNSMQVVYDLPGAGQLSQAMPGREIQFALKLSF
jgi:hypothetical protein